jgi:predicted DNA-binding helix-hairpin-helix protein
VAPQLNAHGAGLLLSSAVDGSPDSSAGALVDSANLLRRTHDYRGYIHLKLPPGVSHAVVEAAARVADRLSLNIEVPSAAHQQRLDASRDWRRDVVARLAWMRDLARAGFLKAGIATQFVVGAAGESDAELLRATQWLHQELSVTRVYYGAFQPVAGTPMAHMPRTPLVRGQRLLQADWLLRHYGFGADELPFDDDDQLPLSHDPKLAWALQHPEFFPIEINSAAPEQLLRIPGLGPLSIKRIVRLRMVGRLREPAHLAVLGTAAQRVVDFVTFDGRFYGTGVQWRHARKTAARPVVEQLGLGL